MHRQCQIKAWDYWHCLRLTYYTDGYKYSWVFFASTYLREPLRSHGRGLSNTPSSWFGSPLEPALQSVLPPQSPPR